MDINLQLADYVLVHDRAGQVEEQRSSNTLGHGKLFDYVFGSGGVFMRAMRDGLDACVPVSMCEIRGLGPVKPFVKLSFPRVPSALVRKMLNRARAVCVESGVPVEALFYLRFEAGAWLLTEPAQRATGGSVAPEDDADADYAAALIELHSHHQMPAFWSGDDDRDEQGFRLYAVIGEIFTNAVLRVRVGIYGHFHEISADEIFEMPEDVRGFLE